MQDNKSTDDWKSAKISAGRGKETLFRIVLRNQIDLISIADKKANMITSFNAIFISIIITLFGSGIPVQGIPLIERSNLVVPFSILLFFCLGSAVYAILAATPRISKGDKTNPGRISQLFFGNFHNKSLTQHMEDIQQLLESKNEIYEHLTIDMYYNGLILHRKYRLLGIAYKLLMFGVIGFVAGFVATTLISP